MNRLPVISLCVMLATSMLNAAESDQWRDPAFKARFIESYIAETDIEPRVTADERKQLLKIFELLSADKIDEAYELLVKGRTPAASAVFDFTIANIHFQREQWDQAITAYTAAVEKYPKFRRAWKNLGLIYMRQSNFTKALPALTRVIELGGGDAITFGQLGFAYTSIENNLSAESAFRMAVLMDPVTKDWQMGLARSLFKQERFADAAALCAQLIGQDPNRSDLWLLQANAYIGLGKPMRAAENYELVDRMGKSTPESLNTLADIYINDELFDLAVNAYIKAMDMSPNGRPDRALRAARVLTARGANKETRKLVEHVKTTFNDKLSPADQKDLLKLQARLAVAEGAGDEEARVLEEIVQLDPMDGDALILLGQHHGRAGRIEKGIFYYERAAGIPKYEADAKVRHAQLLIGQSKYTEALPLLRNAQQINPRENVQKYLEQVERVAKSR